MVKSILRAQLLDLLLMKMSWRGMNENQIHHAGTEVMQYLLMHFKDFPVYQNKTMFLHSAPKRQKMETVSKRNVNLYDLKVIPII